MEAMLGVSRLAVTLPLVMPPTVAAMNRKASHLVRRTAAAAVSAIAAAAAAVFVARPGNLPPREPAHAVLCGSFESLMHHFRRDGVAQHDRRGFLLHAKLSDHLDIGEALSFLHGEHHVHVAPAEPVRDVAHFVALREASDILSSFALLIQEAGGG